MAVPKKKLYLQIVRSRRSLQNDNWVLKKRLLNCKNNNFYYIYKKSPYCSYCNNDTFKNKVCETCYYNIILKKK